MFQRTKRNKRSTLPTAWTENQNQIESDSEKSSSLPTKLHETIPEETQNCRHQLRFDQETTRKWANAIVIPPRTGNASFSDLGERDMEFVQVHSYCFLREIICFQTACILHADAILRSLRERQLKIPKKTAVSTEGDLFEIDQDTLLNVDRHKLGAPWRQVPLLIDLLCK